MRASRPLVKSTFRIQYYSVVYNECNPNMKFTLKSHIFASDFIYSFIEIKEQTCFDQKLLDFLFVHKYVLLMMTVEMLMIIE